METRTLLVGAAVAVVLLAGGVLAVLSTGGMDQGMDHAGPPTQEDQGGGSADDPLSVRVEHPGYHEGEGGGSHDSNWEKVNGTVDVQLATQGSIQRIEFYLGNQKIHTEANGSWAWRFDTTQHRDCMYKFTAKAFGPNGATYQDTTRIWIDNTDDNCM